MNVIDQADEDSDVFGLFVECPRCDHTWWSRGMRKTTRFHLRERLWRRILVGLMLVLVALGGVVGCEVREGNREARDREYRQIKELLHGDPGKDRDR